MSDQQYWAHPMYEGVFKSMSAPGDSNFDEGGAVEKSDLEAEMTQLSEKWGVTLKRDERGAVVVSPEDKEKLNARGYYPKLSESDRPQFGDEHVYKIQPSSLRVQKPKGYKASKVEKPKTPKRLAKEKPMKKKQGKGPGSRGGQVIGTTRSGKPVYAPHPMHVGHHRRAEKISEEHAQAKKKPGRNYDPHEYHNAEDAALSDAHRSGSANLHVQAKQHGYTHDDHRDAHRIHKEHAKKTSNWSLENAHHDLAEQHMHIAHGTIPLPSASGGAKKGMKSNLEKTAGTMVGPRVSAPTSARKPTGQAGLTPTKAGSPEAARQSASFKPGEASHAEKQATRGAVSRMAHGAARGVGQAASRVAGAFKKPAEGNKSISGEIMTGIVCPHCEEGISKGYAIKALAMLAKSEGYDLTGELESLAMEGFEEYGLTEEEMRDQLEAEKAVTGSTNYVGNKVASHKGSAPGKGPHVGRYRPGGKKGVDRRGKPTNPVTEGGMNKSLSLPIYEGDAQLVDYGFGEDSFVAKSIEEGNLHTPVARNLRAEMERATGEATPE